MKRSYVLTIAAVASLTAVASADSQRAPQARTRLHDVWLSEVLDLDPTRATAAYRDLALQTELPAPHRQLAAARLAELARVRPIPGLDAVQAVVGLSATQRGLLEEARDPVPVKSILMALRDSGETFDDWLREVGGQQPGGTWQAHPLVPTFYAGAQTVSGPEQVRRRQQLLTQLQAARNTGDGRRVRSLQRELRELGSNADRSRLWRMRTLRVLALLLDGDDDLAERLTKAWFREPETIDVTDPVKAIARARERLNTELDAPGLRSNERTVLERLAARIDGWSAAGQHRTAIRFLMKVPVYRDWMTP